jgi:hypothetical protein
MTDVSCYTRMESEIDDIDFVECRDNRELLSKASIDMFDGFNIFKVQGSYANLVDAHKQPGLIQTIGLYLNTDCADTTDEQSAKFGHNMGKFHADAIASLERDFPGAPMIFITVDVYNFVSETYMSKDLTRLPVMKTCNGCSITNVRYGESDPAKVYYDEDQYATCVNIPFNTIKHYVSEEGGLDAFALAQLIQSCFRRQSCEDAHRHITGSCWMSPEEAG